MENARNAEIESVCEVVCLNACGHSYYELSPQFLTVLLYRVTVIICVFMLKLKTVLVKVYSCAQVTGVDDHVHLTVGEKPRHTHESLIFVCCRVCAEGQRQPAGGTEHKVFKKSNILYRKCFIQYIENVCLS